MIRRVLALALILGLGACQLTVKVEAPQDRQEVIDTTCKDKPCDI